MATFYTYSGYSTGDGTIGAGTGAGDITFDFTSDPLRGLTIREDATSGTASTQLGTSTTNQKGYVRNDDGTFVNQGGSVASANLAGTFTYDDAGTTRTGYVIQIGSQTYWVFDPDTTSTTITVDFNDVNSSPAPVDYDTIHSGDETISQSSVTPPPDSPNLGGNDTIVAGEGDDNINARGGSDRVEGGLGDDTLRGGSGDDTVVGGEGDDSLFGQENDDSLQGGIGSDTISGGNDNDTLEGGDGDDSLIGGGDDDSILGGIGNDTIFGDEAIIIDPDSDVELFGFDRTDVDTTGSTNTGGTGVGNEAVGDYILYNGVARTAEGVLLDARLVYVSNTDAQTGTNEIGVDLNNDDFLVPGNPASGLDPNIVLLNGAEDATNSAYGSPFNRIANSGVQVVIRVEFYEAGTFNHGDTGVTGDETGTLLELNGTFSFQDLDRVSGSNFEAVTVNTTEFDSYTVTDATSLQITDNGTNFVFAGGVDNTSQTNPDAQVNLGFSNREDFTVSLRSRASQSGYTFDTENFTVSTTEVILNGDGADFVDAGDGDDEVYGGAAADTLEGGSGADTIFGDGGDDELDGGDDADSIEGGTGGDTIAGGTDGSADTLDGGVGNDEVKYTRNEIIAGGFGSDTFSYVDDGGGAAGFVTIEGGEDSDDGDIDIFSWEGSGVGGNGLVYYTDTTYTTTSATPTEQGIYTFPDGTEVRFREIETAICFTRGTWMSTVLGPRLIQDLRVGDLVVTRDRGLQPIRWIGKRLMPAIDRFAPIRFEAGAIGNTTPLEVSPQHRMLLHNCNLRMTHDAEEMLVAAHHMVNGTTIRARETGMVEYYHILCDRHELLYANGVPSESFHPGEMGLRSIEDAARHELLSIFPELAVFGAASYGPSARSTLKRHEAMGLLDLAV